MTKHVTNYQQMTEKAEKMSQNGGGFTVRQLATPPGRNYTKAQARAFVSWAEKNGVIVKTGQSIKNQKRGRPQAVYVFRAVDQAKS